MKRTIIFILLTIVISSQQNEICTNLGCAVVEKPKK